MRRRRSRTLPWGRIEGAGAAVASSLHSRSVNTEPIKTSSERLARSTHLCNGSGGSSFNGAFLPECVSDQCFRTAAAVCQWKYALVPPSVRVHPVHGHRGCCPRRVGQGHLDDVGGRRRSRRRRRHRGSIMRNAFRKIARGFVRPLRRDYAPIVRAAHGDSRRRRRDRFGRCRRGRRRHVLIACFAIERGMDGRRDVAGRGDVNTCSTPAPTALPEASAAEILVAKPLLDPSQRTDRRHSLLAAQYSFRTIKQPHE